MKTVTSLEDCRAIKFVLVQQLIKNILFVFLEGIGKPSQKRSYEAFERHIKPNSTLMHDKDNAHKKLIEKLSLKSICYSSKELKGIADSENPLNSVNRIHCLLKMFLNAHSGFNRDDLQAYLNLFSFVINPPYDHLEKV